ncbi:MAG: YigZ family protein [Lachnospiraceae bacterium]|nr:YigZ family protein [Lachnospiraceae bacterium]
MKVILENTTAEIVEKKSRFIANIFYVANVEEAEEKLVEIKKKYYDAKHNCFAYVIGINGEQVKSSDDGEPQGTAGHPMLDILKGNELTNCIAIVTRYFGGTLLGTGGLVRAYSDSLKAAIANAKLAEIKNSYEVSFDVSYDDYGKIEKLIQNYNNTNDGLNNIYSLDKTFEDVVKLKYLVDVSIFEKLKKEIINLTKGKVALDDDSKQTYYFSDNKVNYL